MTSGGHQVAYLECREPQKAVDTFHAVTGIVWPELPPWPTAQRRRTKARRLNGDARPESTSNEDHAYNQNTGAQQQPQQQNGAVKTSVNGARSGGDAVGGGTEIADASAPRRNASRQAVELPEEFQLLKTGTPSAFDVHNGLEDDVLSMTPTSAWGSTGGERFLQVRTRNTRTERSQQAKLLDSLSS